MDIIEEIKKLKALLDQGAINEEEFNSLKKKVLSEINDLKEDKEPTSSSSTTETIPIQKKKKPSSDVNKPIKKGKKSEEVQVGSEWTETLAYFVLAAAILLSMVFWFRYDSFWVFVIVLAVSILIPWLIGKATLKALHKNLYFVSLIVLYVILISYPIGDIKSSSSSSNPDSNEYNYGTTSNPSTVVHHCTYCGKAYTGKGYYHIFDNCELDDGTMDHMCSVKCCQEEWSHDRNNPRRR